LRISKQLSPNDTGQPRSNSLPQLPTTVTEGILDKIDHFKNSKIPNVGNFCQPLLMKKKSKEQNHHLSKKSLIWWRIKEGGKFTKSLYANLKKCPKMNETSDTNS
jgi:hypothetical protein